MNLKNSIASILVIAIIATITFATAATIVEYLHPHTIIVTPKIVLEEYLDGELIANGSQIEWGTWNASDIIYYNYTVKCVGQPCTVALYVANLPLGWSLAWTANNTALTTGAYAEGNLELTIPASANGTYSWSTTLRGF